MSIKLENLQEGINWFVAGDKYGNTFIFTLDKELVWENKVNVTVHYPACPYKLYILDLETDKYIMTYQQGVDSATLDGQFLNIRNILNLV